MNSLKKILGIVAVALIITGCGGGRNSSSTPTIIGYVEDNPIFNSEIDSFQNLIVKTTTDTNGKYTLNTQIAKRETKLLFKSYTYLSD